MTDEKVWLVTGAGRGLGLDVAKAALTAGHRVVATGRDAGKVAAALGPHANLLTVKLDVTQPEDSLAAVKVAHAQVHELGGAPPVAIGEEDHRVVARAVAAVLGSAQAWFVGMRTTYRGHPPLQVRAGNRASDRSPHARTTHRPRRDEPLSTDRFLRRNSQPNAQRVAGSCHCRVPFVAIHGWLEPP